MEAERLIRAAEVRLRIRDYAGSRSSALEAMQLDPTITGAEQIIAICDVFLSIESNNGNPNWYSILKLEPFTEDDDLIIEQFRNLSALLTPSRNSYSHAYEAYKIVRDAFRVLSSEDKKVKYDEELKGKEGFFTMCPFCYWVFEYEKIYVDCCLRCRNCKRGFHGVEIKWPPDGVAGSDRLYGFMPFGVNVVEGGKKDTGGGENGNGPKWVEISDDDDEEMMKSKSAGQSQNGAGRSGFQPGGNVDGVSQRSRSSEGGNVRGRGRGRKKTVARSYKKVTGRGIPRSQMGAVQDSLDREDGEASGVGGGKVASESANVADAVEFMDGDDDLMVCLEDL